MELRRTITAIISMMMARTRPRTRSSIWTRSCGWNLHLQTGLVLLLLLGLRPVVLRAELLCPQQHLRQRQACDSTGEVQRSPVPVEATALLRLSVPAIQVPLMLKPCLATALAMAAMMMTMTMASTASKWMTKV